MLSPLKKFLFLIAAMLFPATASPQRVRSNTATVQVYFYMPESQSLACDLATCRAELNLGSEKTVTFSAVLVEQDGTRIQSPRIDAFQDKPLCDEAGCGPVYSARVAGRQTIEFRFFFTAEQLAHAEQLVAISEVI